VVARAVELICHALSDTCIAFGLVIVISCGCESSKQTPSSPLSTASTANEQAKPANADGTIRSIPLDSVVTTANQPELQHARATYDAEGYTEPYGKFLEQLLGEKIGASNVFLVEAPGITEAVSASRGVLIGARAADTPAPLNMPDPPRGSYWLVVFLGIRGSSPGHWLVDSVTVHGDVVRFSYHRRGSGGRPKTCINTSTGPHSAHFSLERLSWSYTTLN
jgi:hypothetical protein